jgi:hypothetical protein
MLVTVIAASYLPYESEQQRLPADSLQDWLPQGHMEYIIGDRSDSLKLSALHER